MSPNLVPPFKIEPHHLDGVQALVAAESTPLVKQPGERDTEFVKRIVCAFHNAARTPLYTRWSEVADALAATLRAKPSCSTHRVADPACYECRRVAL
jgi:hypothetical protein